MNLERAIEIAVNAHKGVTDKGGNPYIVHPLRVMMSLKSDNEKIVGALHVAIFCVVASWSNLLFLRMASVAQPLITVVSCWSYVTPLPGE